MDGLLKTTPEALEGLSIEKRAEIDGGLPEELSIKDIAKLAYLDDTEKQEALIKVIVGSCKAGKLAYYGNIDGWKYREDMPNPYPKVKGDYALIILGDYVNTLYAYSDDCLIHRDYFKFYLQNQNQWPVNGLLRRWWGDDQIATHPVTNKEIHESTANPKTVASNQDWKDKARQIAEKILCENRRLSIEQIAEKTRNEMIRLKEAGDFCVTGKGGRVPSADTIKRHALTGLKS